MKVHSTEFIGRDMTMKFQPKTVYGQTLMYPINTRAKALCALMGVKSLSNAKAKEIHENVFPLTFETEKQWYEHAA